MKKTFKKFAILAVALCLVALSLVLAACGAPAEPENNKVTYTVSVTADEPAALEGVTVVLKKDGTTVGSSALTEGKATFELEPADYVATLTGVSGDYEFSDGSLSATTLSCSIALVKKQPESNETTYIVTATYPAYKDVYGNTIKNSAPASGLTVALYEGKLESDKPSDIEDKTPVATGTTNSSGRAQFTLEGELYTVVISGYDARTLSLKYEDANSKVNVVTKDMSRFDASFTQTYRYGETDDLPLEFTLGQNDVPVTLELLSELNETSYGAVVYAFTPENSGAYTFSVTGAGQMTSETFGNATLRAGSTIVVRLEAGETYLFMCGISTTEGDLSYFVNIVEGGKLDDEGGEGGEHVYPWTQGSGTLDAPYVTDSLAGEYKNLYVKAATPFYLAYTPRANETYTLEAIGANLWLEVYDDPETATTGDGYLLRLSDDEDEPVHSDEIALAANTTYYFAIGTWDDAAGNVGFKATLTSSEAPQTPWTQGSGTQQDPYILTSLPYDYSFEIADENSKIYLKYTPSADETYTVSTTDENLCLDIFKGTLQSSPQNVSTDTSLSAKLELSEGEDVIFVVDAMTQYGETVYFNITRGASGGEEEQPPTTLQKYTVTVLAKDSSGNTTPIQGVRVSISDDIENPTEATTDANGVATFNCEPGTYHLWVYYDHDLYRDDSDISFNVSVDQPDLVIPLTLLENVRAVDIAIKYADGTAADEGLTVQLIDSGNAAHKVLTDKDGVAHFHVADGDYTVQVPERLFQLPEGWIGNGPQPADGQQFHDSKHKITVTADASLTFSYDKTRAVDVTVKNSNGTFAAGVTVEISDEYNKTYSATTDQNGVAHFDCVIDGEYTIIVGNVIVPRATLTVSDSSASAQVTNPRT